MSKVLIVDGMNFLHRARSGFGMGDYFVAFNFFRNLRALVERHAPTRCIMALEGHPQKRYDLLPEYKANRRGEVDLSDPVAVIRQREVESFFRQTDLVVGLVSKRFPVSVVRHPNFEGDDVVYNLIKRSSAATDWIVASNDSDFNQLLDEFSNVKLYNPMMKTLTETRKGENHNYLTWKALRGDPSDNVPCVPGVNDARAAELASDHAKLGAFLAEGSNGEAFARNFYLIKLAEWTDDEAVLMTSSEPTKDWDAVRQAFESWQFQSLLKDKVWDKFQATFDTLWT